MKTLLAVLLFPLLISSVFAQTRTQEYYGEDSIVVSTADTSNFFHVRGRFQDNPQKPVRVFFEIFTTDAQDDTLIVQEKVPDIGRGTSLDSLWKLKMIYNTYVSETPDTVIIVNKLPLGGGSVKYTEAITWSQFCDGFYRLIRLRPGMGRTHVIRFRVTIIKKDE